MITKELVEYLKNNELINNSKHGFLKNKSCLINWLEFTERISEYSDAGTGTTLDWVVQKQKFLYFLGLLLI